MPQLVCRGEAPTTRARAGVDNYERLVVFPEVEPVPPISAELVQGRRDLQALKKLPDIDRPEPQILA